MDDLGKEKEYQQQNHHQLIHEHSHLTYISNSDKSQNKRVCKINCKKIHKLWYALLIPPFDCCYILKIHRYKMDLPPDLCLHGVLLYIFLLFSMNV